MNYSTFAAFFTRAADQLRMAAVSFANIKCAGSHVGVSIGEDGPSQMGLEDIALFRYVDFGVKFSAHVFIKFDKLINLELFLDPLCSIQLTQWQQNVRRN